MFIHAYFFGGCIGFRPGVRFKQPSLPASSKVSGKASGPALHRSGAGASRSMGPCFVGGLAWCYAGSTRFTMCFVSGL